MTFLCNSIISNMPGQDDVSVIRIHAAYGRSTYLPPILSGGPCRDDCPSVELATTSLVPPVSYCSDPTKFREIESINRHINFTAWR